MDVDHPKSDDFRVEIRGAELVVTFTPTGATFVFETNPEDGGSSPKVVRRGADSAYSETEVRRIAIELAQVARRGLDEGPGDL